MAKFCMNCGNEVDENATVCIKCGCLLQNASNIGHVSSSGDIVNTISQRIKTNGIIWSAIGIIQILSGLFYNWIFLIVGVLNLISSIQDLNYSKAFPQKPVGLVSKVKPLTSPIITLVYNLLIGGIIGVAGSIYYFVAVRGYVLENEQAFLEIENQQNTSNL